MKKLLVLISLIITCTVNAQINLIPDGSFEEGNAGGTANAYYYYDNATLWRSWPFIGFATDTDIKKQWRAFFKTILRSVLRS